MPKFGCVCGNVINLSEIWSENELRLVPMGRIGQIADMLDEGKALTGDQFYDLIGEVSVAVYKCPVCSRLHLETRKHRFDAYVKEVVS